MFDLITLADMSKKEKTVLVHARILESDVAELDKAASEQPIRVSRSMQIALAIRDWASRRRSPKKK